MMSNLQETVRCDHMKETFLLFKRDLEKGQGHDQFFSNMAVTLVMVIKTVMNG